MDLHIRDALIFGEHNQSRHTPYINWIWDRDPLLNSVTVFTDTHLAEASQHPSPTKIAVLIEPPVVSGYAYDFIRAHYDLFQYVFTFDESLLSISDKFIPYTWGTPWIGKPEWKIYPKDRMVSIIASSKNFAEGHRLRHEVANRYRDSMDLLGTGYRAIGNKTDGLAPYRYSVTIENCKIDSYFSEKLLDCFVTGTVPIYWGCPRIKDFFDPDGIISFDTSDDLGEILKSLSEEDYTSRMPAIERNFERVLEYEYFEKPIFDFLKRTDIVM